MSPWDVRVIKADGNEDGFFFGFLGGFLQRGGEICFLILGGALWSFNARHGWKSTARATKYC